MFKFLRREKKFNFYSQKDVDEINLISSLIREHKFQEALSLNTKALEPSTNTYDSIKLLLFLIAASVLKERNLAISLFDRILFRDGLRLYEKHDRLYLEKCAEITLKGNFGEALDGFPNSFSRVKPKKPNLEKVDQYLKELFVLELV